MNHCGDDNGMIVQSLSVSVRLAKGFSINHYDDDNGMIRPAKAETKTTPR